MTVPWPSRPTQGLYHIDQAEALTAAGLATTVLSPAPAVPRWAGRWSSWALRHLDRPERYRVRGVEVLSPRAVFSFPGPVRRQLAPRLPAAVDRLCTRALTPLLRDQLRQKPFEALIVHGTLPWGGAAAVAATEARIPFAIIEHSAGDILRLQPGTPLADLYTRAARRARVVYVVSRPMLRHLRDVLGLTNVTLALNGVQQPPADVGVAARPSDLRDKPLLLSAGHYYRRKGFEELIEAFAGLITRGADANLVMITEPPEALKASLEAKGLGGRLRVVKPCSRAELMQWMTWADLFVLPSWREAFGLVYAEAMACGTAVVMTEDCGFAEELPSGRPGAESPAWVVPPRDVGALTQALAHALDDPDLLRRKGQAGRRLVVERFSWAENARGIRRHLLDDALPAAA